MRWDDGMKISPVGEGFVLYEFRPGRPLYGVPTRVLAATLANTAKFEKHLAGRRQPKRFTNGDGCRTFRRRRNKHRPNLYPLGVALVKANRKRRRTPSEEFAPEEDNDGKGYSGARRVVESEEDSTDVTKSSKRTLPKKNRKRR